MSDDRWRCFVAVPIGEALRADLRTLVDAWRDLDGPRWTDPDGWHITLAFLGPIDAASVPGLTERLTSIAVQSSMSFQSGGLGAFPTPARARVAWYGVEDAGGRLAGFADDVARALDLRVRQPFRAHVTLARSRRRPMDLRAWLASASAPEGVVDVDRIALMRSHVGEGPAQYETLSTIPLGVAAGA
ncbi:MAG: RNA 2',3'-cyclic phosphodiesterase [Candidatus Limnocylindria bacterium]